MTEQSSPAHEQASPSIEQVAGTEVDRFSTKLPYVRPARSEGIGAVGRFAPTPSGFLHLGNAVNALLAADAVTSGTLALRIDDLDPQRISLDSVADIFASLRWLGIEWSIGPQSVDDYLQTYRHADQTSRYRHELTTAIRNGLQTYFCTCSRSELARAHWRRACDWESHPCRVRESAPDELHTIRAVLADGSEDPVLWRRDDLPGYHLTSVVDDRDIGVTSIVRGHDLMASSETQMALARCLAADNVADASYTHHALVCGSDGRKLSKSDAADSLADYASRGGSTRTVAALAKRVAGAQPGELVEVLE